MFLRILVIAVFSGAAASATVLALSGPVWLAVLAYPATGTVTLLGALALAGFGNSRPQKMRAPSSPLTSPLPAHCPVPRSTTPTVASNTLISVTNDKLRS